MASALLGGVGVLVKIPPEEADVFGCMGILLLICRGFNCVCWFSSTLELFEDGGGDNPVSINATPEFIELVGVVLANSEDVNDVVVLELSQGPAEVDWPRKLSPWY